MELKYEEFLNLTWREFDYYSMGYRRRVELGWDYTRNIMAMQHNSIPNFSKGKKSALKPTDIITLPTLDKASKVELGKVDQDTIEKYKEILKRDYGNSNK